MWTIGKLNWGRWIHEYEHCYASTAPRKRTDWTTYYIKSVRHFVSIQSPHTLFFFPPLKAHSFLLLSSYCALFLWHFGITKKTDQYETLKFVYAVNFEICVELSTHYTYTLAVCSSSTYLWALEICVIFFFSRGFFFAAAAEGAKPNKHAKLASHSCIKHSFKLELRT